MLSVDIQELKAWKENTEALAKIDMDKFCIDTTKELAVRLIRKIVFRTPVGKSTYVMRDVYINKFEKAVYKRGKRKGQVKQERVKGHHGGTLRRGWTDQIDKLRVGRKGDYYIITIVNPVRYASYVENGHRQTPGRYVPAIGKKLKQSWVKGQFMVKKSEIEMDKNMEGIISMRLIKMLKEKI